MLKQRGEKEARSAIEAFKEHNFVLTFLLFVIHLTSFSPLPTLPHASPRDIFLSFFYIQFDKLCNSKPDQTEPNQDEVTSVPFPTPSVLTIEISKCLLLTAFAHSHPLPI